MRRLLLVVAVMVAMVAVMAAPAFARTYNNNPYSSPSPGSHGNTYVLTYKAPPAEGGSAPGSSAAGGNPGYLPSTGICHGPHC